MHSTGRACLNPFKLTDITSLPLPLPGYCRHRHHVACLPCQQLSLQAASLLVKSCAARANPCHKPHSRPHVSLRACVFCSCPCAATTQMLHTASRVRVRERTAYPPARGRPQHNGDGGAAAHSKLHCTHSHTRSRCQCRSRWHSTTVRRQPRTEQRAVRRSGLCRRSSKLAPHPQGPVRQRQV
jgi:hypothetical protein